MTIYTWPDTRTFVPQVADLQVIDNTQRSLESPLSGYVQTVSMPGARWGWAMDFAPQDSASRAALEAQLLKLSGREHRVRLWDIKHPRPRGNIVLTGVTLGAAAAQFATSLQLAGCLPGNNVLAGGSFEVDSNSDGLADGWTRYSAGTVGTLSAALSSGVASHGAYSQSLSAASLGSSQTDRQGITRSSVNVAALAGKTATLSCVVLGTLNSSVEVQAAWRDAGGAVISGMTTSVALTTGYQTIVLTGACPANAVTAILYIFQHSNTGVAPGLYVDAVQLEAGSSRTAYAVATLRAGDWLGLPTGQLVRVVADAQADDLGRMTVDVRHMLRAAAASGSAVTLDRPTALYVRAEAGLTLPRMAGGSAPGMSAEFVEVFA